MAGRNTISLLFVVVSLFFVNSLFAEGGYYIQQAGPDGIISIEAENYADKQGIISSRQVPTG
ncbi:MAG: hypothetical protein ACYSX1_06160 [Planctomycetota bacterium]|jgi:hypothetical protein